MATVRDLIKGSLRLIGAIATGETPSAEECNDSLSTLNDMVESWSLENLMIYAQVRDSFALIPGKQTYTMGIVALPVVADFASFRPVKLDLAAIETNACEMPLSILSMHEWAALSVKSVGSSLPSMIFIDDTYPLAQVNMWPIPNVANNLILYSSKTLMSFASINDTLSFPPGFAKALRYNLALELAPEYGKQPDTAVIAGAIESKANIKVQNSDPGLMSCDLNFSKPFNWLTGM